jgi:hypothetical protein
MQKTEEHYTKAYVSLQNSKLVTMFFILRAFRRNPWWYANYLRTFVWIALFWWMWCWDTGLRGKSARVSKSTQPCFFIDSTADGEAFNIPKDFGESWGNFCYLVCLY